jgi:GDP-4-dehydro-6-deoxy-D-mannose reductase
LTPIWRGTEPAWSDKLFSGRILVTGAAGFVGRNLLPMLAKAFPQADVAPSGFDVTNAEAVRITIEQMRPDAVIHLAAIAAVGLARRDPDVAWQVNLHGTLNLARAVLAVVPDCALVFASTADAYGSSFQSGHPLDETAALAPLNTYSATKAAADLTLGAMASEGLRAIRLRPFNHTGRGQTDDFVIPSFARQVARIEAELQEPVINAGALDPFRDFLDVRDVCAAYTACIAHVGELAPGLIINIASGQSRRVGDVLQALLDLAGVQAEIRLDAGRLRPTEIGRAAGNAALAARLLGWTPQIPWDQTLREVLADWQQRVQVQG